jgi:hypothetical protein
VAIFVFLGKISKYFRKVLDKILNFQNLGMQIVKIASKAFLYKISAVYDDF